MRLVLEVVIGQPDAKEYAVLCLFLTGNWELSEQLASSKRV